MISDITVVPLFSGIEISDGENTVHIENGSQLSKLLFDINRNSIYVDMPMISIGLMTSYFSRKKEKGEENIVTAQAGAKEVLSAYFYGKKYMNKRVFISTGEIVVIGKVYKFVDEYVAQEALEKFGEGSSEIHLLLEEKIK